MANRIVFKYPEMEAAAGKIDNYASEYEQAAATFLSTVQSATASWEGESKERFTALVEGSVYNYMHKSVPEMVKGLAQLLRNNSATMQNADSEIAKNIPDSI